MDRFRLSWSFCICREIWLVGVWRLEDLYTTLSIVMGIRFLADYKRIVSVFYIQIQRTKAVYTDA